MCVPVLKVGNPVCLYGRLSGNPVGDCTED